MLVLKKGLGCRVSTSADRDARAPRPAADLGPEAVVGGGAVHRDHAEHELAEVDAAVRVQVEGLRCARARDRCQLPLFQARYSKRALIVQKAGHAAPSGWMAPS